MIKFTDLQIKKISIAIENETDDAIKLTLKALLSLLLDIREEVRKINKMWPSDKVYTKPTGNKKDIIVGKSLNKIANTTYENS